MPEPPDSDREVLTSLPRSRPTRRSSKRGERPAPEASARASAKPVAPPEPRAAKAAPKDVRKPAQRTTTRPPSPEAAPAAESRRVPPQRRVPAAGYAAPDGRAGEPSVSPAVEVISTTVQAAAELAQIGLTVGRQTLQSMLERLPKP